MHVVENRKLKLNQQRRAEDACRTTKEHACTFTLAMFLTSQCVWLIANIHTMVLQRVR